MSRDSRPASQWPEPRASGVRLPIETAQIVASPNGGYAVDTDSDATPAGHLVLDANGAPAIDTEASTGAAIRVTSRRITGVS